MIFSPLQPALQVKSPYSLDIPTVPSETQPRTPSPDEVATRLHCIANYKLRLESNQNEPNLRKVLGHINIYDAIREHQQKRQIQSSPPVARRREQQLRRRQQSESNRLASLSPIDEDEDSQSENAAEIKEYLSHVCPPSEEQVQDFASFQRAIAAQLAALSKLRIEAASRQLYHMTQDEDDDELAVEEYDETLSDADDSDDSSDYDSYDGDGDWRVFEDDPSAEDGAESDSSISEPPSPTTEAPPSQPGATLEGCEKKATSVSYFIPLRPVRVEDASVNF